MHDRLLTALQGIAGVQLVAALRDDRLGFPEPNDLRVFIPDIHLISEQRLVAGGFKFRNNHEELLVALLGALKRLRAAAGPGRTVGVTQLGDVLDLWRETAGLDPTENIAARIANDHATLINALLDPDLDASVFLGNHDYDLYLWASYAGCVHKLFIPENAPQVLVLHGDIFDCIEKLPDAVQQFLVYFFARDVPPTDYALGKMRDLVRQTAPAPGEPAHIHCPTPANLGALLSTDGPIPARYNLQRAGTPNAGIQFLDAAYEQVQKANAQHNLAIKTVIIGHTHHARIAVREDGGNLFTLIDCGAWIENCSEDGATNPKPNCQIAALSGNEARIYQLSPLNLP